MFYSLKCFDINENVILGLFLNYVNKWCMGYKEDLENWYLCLIEMKFFVFKLNV